MCVPREKLYTKGPRSKKVGRMNFRKIVYLRALLKNNMVSNNQCVQYQKTNIAPISVFNSLQNPPL